LENGLRVELRKSCNDVTDGRAALVEAFDQSGKVFYGDCVTTIPRGFLRELPKVCFIDLFCPAENRFKEFEPVTCW
jgi:hypothetical protein